ncbi:AlpA family phage regulatory protein [Bradyrhizobium sp. USDA 3256]
MAARLISYEQLKATKGIGLSKLQLWRLEKRNQFPRRVRTSPGRFAWIESEIDAYITQKIAERDAAMVAA